MRRLTSSRFHVRVSNVSDREAGDGWGRDGETGVLNRGLGLHGDGWQLGGSWLRLWGRLYCWWPDGQEGEVILPLKTSTFPERGNWAIGSLSLLIRYVYIMQMFDLFLLSSEMFPSEESSDAATFSWEWAAVTFDPWFAVSAPGGKPWSANSRVGLSYDKKHIQTMNAFLYLVWHVLY